MTQYKYSNKNIVLFSIRNSILNYISNKNNLKYKINNEIKVVYYDNILNKNVYGFVNGLKKSSFINTDQLTKYVFNKNFISYFQKLLNNFEIFQIYPRSYINLFLNSFYDKKIQIYPYYKNYLLKKEANLFSRDHNVFKKYNSYNNHSGMNIILLKIFYKKLTFVDNFGKIFNFSRETFSKKVFTGLIRILSKRAKIYFLNIMLLPNLLFNYINLLKKNKKIKHYKITLYFFLYHFNIKRFYYYLKKKRLKIRKSNFFLKKFNVKFSINNFKLINLYYKILFFNKNFFYNLKHYNCFLNNFSFDQNINLLGNNFKSKIFFFNFIVENFINNYFFNKSLLKKNYYLKVFSIVNLLYLKFILIKLTNYKYFSFMNLNTTYLNLQFNILDFYFFEFNSKKKFLLFLIGNKIKRFNWIYHYFKFYDKKRSFERLFYDFFLSKKNFYLKLISLQNLKKFTRKKKKKRKKKRNKLLHHLKKKYYNFDVDIYLNKLIKKRYFK